MGAHNILCRSFDQNRWSHHRPCLQNMMELAILFVSAYEELFVHNILETECLRVAIFMRDHKHRASLAFSVDYFDHSLFSGQVILPNEDITLVQSGCHFIKDYDIIRIPMLSILFISADMYK